MKSKTFLKDTEGNDSSSRLIVFILVGIAQGFLFATIFATDFTAIEIGSLYGTIMGFAWTFKTQSKMGENRELRIKGELYNSSIEAKDTI